MTQRGASDVLALGFGTTVAMWGLGYLGRLPGSTAPSWLIGTALLACLVAGGFVAGRTTGRGWAGGAQVGLLASVLNLLVLGSVVASHEPNRVAPSALWWLPGSLLLGALLGGLGAAIGAARPAAARPRNWTGAFAAVAAGATFLLLAVGGLVTSHAAGLAVVDWPNSFGYNMFLYPLARMTGGIYFEHAHRLLGSLVGVTVLVLALHLQRSEPRAWLRRLAWLALGMVVVQGVLGGLRVTGRFTLSTSPADVAPSLALAIVHGVLGQLFFAVMVGLAVATSTTWRSERQPAERASATADRQLSAILIGVVFVQLVLGAVQRHLVQGLLVHITLAVLVLSVGLAAALRVWGLYGEIPVLPRLGRAVLVLLVLQVMLGVVALAAIAGGPEVAASGGWRALARTVHQANGALLLGGAVMLRLWVGRLLVPPR
jgi:cytochrome c oxidase assembly protein subunit 15